MDLGLNGRTAIVCGGSSGIGLGCAQVLAGEGVTVWLVARNEDRLAAAAERIRKAGGRVRTIMADLSQPEAPVQIAEAVPSVNILVTNPGISPAGGLTDRAIWVPGVEAIVATSLDLIGRVLPGMRSRGYGRIVNITSSGAFEAGAALGFSGALRAAITHASASLAREVGGDGVTINNIAPGPVHSEGLEHFFARRAGELGCSVEDVRQSRLAAIPARRFADAAEVGAICAMLASPFAASVTGRSILMDGGANSNPFL
jgi:3-oxoacyl-[acyl-carrier protein] reductase